MSRTKFYLWQKILGVLLAEVLMSFSLWNPPAQAGCLFWFLCSGSNSGVTRGGAIRGPCASTEQIPLTALVPDNQPELTVEPYPTFWFYIPAYNSRVEFAKFMLLDANNHPVLKQPILVKLPESSGIAKFTLPKTESVWLKERSLEVGKSYYWFFSVVCNPRKPSLDPNVKGAIERVERTSRQESQLKNAPVEQPYLVYAKNGIVWYDSLTRLIEERDSYPEDWMALLQRFELPESVREKAIAQLQAVDLSYQTNRKDTEVTEKINKRK